MNKKILMLMVLGVFMFSFASAALTDNIVAYYPFEGDLTDSVNSYDGTNSGTTNSSGIIGSGRSFDGISDFITVSDTADLDFGTGDFSINLWVVDNDKGSNIIHKAKPTASWDGWLIRTHGSLGTVNPTFSGSGIITGTTNIESASTFYMITWVRSSGVNKLYVDSVQEGSNVSNSLNLDSIYDLFIGKDQGFGEYHDGKIDELGLWKGKALSQSEITELYNSGAGITYPFGSPTSNPIVVLLTPTNNSKQTSSIINFTANISVSEGFNHTNQTITIWHANQTIFYSDTLTEDYNLTVIPEWSVSGFELGMDYTWNVLAYGNDSLNTYATNNFTFTASVFSEDSVTFENSVLETSNKQFNLTINSTGVSEISSLFWYNGTSYGAVTIDLGDGNYKAVRSIDIPLQNSVGNKSFHWQFDFILTNSNSLQQNSTVYSQEVNRTFFTLCNATFTTPFIDFTSRDAENPFPVINISFKSAWTWYVDGGTGSIFRNLSYEDVTETASNFQFCGSPNATFIANADIEMDADGFAQNYYYLVDSSLSNDVENINLYLLNDTLATPTTLLVRDKFQNLIEGMLIHVQLYDVGTNTFYTIGMARTNENGEDNFYLNWFDSLYKFILIQDGTTILETNVTKVFETPKIFELPDVTTYSFDKFNDFEFTLSFDELIKTFSLTYVKPSGEVEEGCLRVTKRTSLSDTEICLTCSSSASATLFCDISSAGNGTFIASFYATGSWFLIDWIDKVIGESFSEGINDLLNQDDAAFYTIILIGIVMSMFLFNPVLGIIGALLGLLAAGALGFTVLTYGLYLGIVIIGGVIIWILKR